MRNFYLAVLLIHFLQIIASNEPLKPYPIIMPNRVSQLTALDAKANETTLAEMMTQIDQRWQQQLRYLGPVGPYVIVKKIIWNQVGGDYEGQYRPDDELVRALIASVERIHSLKFLVNSHNDFQKLLAENKQLREQLAQATKPSAPPATNPGYITAQQNVQAPARDEA